MVDAEHLKMCIKEIRKRTTVKIWAVERGFNYQTVIKVLHGYTGKRQIGVTNEIIKALREDGCLGKEAA